MKRDMDLIRAILLKAEEITPENKMGYATISGKIQVSESGYIFHVKLLYDNGYIDAILKKDESGTYHGGIISGITLDGYKFLDNIRDNEVWKMTKKTIGSKILSVGIEIISSTAAKVISDGLK